MAKKKNENTLSYLQMPLPQGGKYSKMTKVAFGGLNKRHSLDSGNFSMESNISTNEYPYLTPAEQKKSMYSKYETPISMSAFDGFIVVVYYEKTLSGDTYKYETKVDYITKDGKVHTGILQSYRDEVVASIDTPRSIVQFNVYDTPTDPLTGQYVKKLLFFPDKASMFMNIVETKSNPATWETDYKNASAEEKGTTELAKADLGVMYCYYDGGEFRKYYTVVETKNTANDGTVTYTRKVVNKCEKIDTDNNATYVQDEFYCDGMDALVKEFTPADGKEEPPDTASHNYYYRNSETSMVYRWVDDESDSENSGWKISIPPAIPTLKYATVHLSRVFGVDDDRVYASGYNNYANWNLDTVDEYNEANSWCSPSQSNTKAGGNFTGITTFQNHVICFKHDFMHEIYNTKNPFRLQDIYAEGAIDQRTIQDVDGKLIFVSEDDVKIYTGSNPRIIGYNLNMARYEYAVSGTDNRNYYLYCEDGNGSNHLYVYDTYTELWSEQSIDVKVRSFAHNKNGMYMLDDDGYIYKMDTGTYSHNWSCETDLITNKTVDIKHIKKLQMLAEIPETVNGITNVDADGKPANMQVYILYDDEVFDELENKASRLVYSSSKYGRLPIRVKPRKTANYGFKLHFEGAGYVKLYELEIFVEQGGAMYV